MKKVIFLVFLMNSLGYGVQLKEESIKNTGEEYNHQYLINNGDNLYKISRKFNLPMNSLIKINSIENPDLIYAGNKLKVNSKLAELGKKYEVLGNDIWKNDKVDLEDRIYKSLNSYRIAKQLYKKSEVLYDIDIELKILKINYLKEALKLEKVGDIYYVKEQKVKARKKYEEMLKRLDLYLDLERKEDKALLTRVERVEKILEQEEISVENNTENGKVTFVSFIDRNNDTTLDLDDILITEGYLEIDGKKVEISSSGNTEIEGIRVEKISDILLTSRENTVKESGVNAKVDGKKVFAPIKTDIATLSGSIRLMDEISNIKKSDVYENLLLRIKNQVGEEVLLLPVDRNGNFYIDKIVKGEYYYDIEVITDSGIEVLENNKKIIINNNDFLLKLKVKDKLLKKFNYI